jgi:hypothetical protein
MSGPRIPLTVAALTLKASKRFGGDLKTNCATGTAARVWHHANLLIFRKEENFVLDDQLCATLRTEQQYRVYKAVPRARAAHSLPQKKRHPAERVPFHNRDTRAARRRRVLSVPLNFAHQTPRAQPGSVLKSILERQCGRKATYGLHFSAWENSTCPRPPGKSTLCAA